MRRGILATLIALASLLPAASARAGCGCDKPPPPRAAIRPFVAHADEFVTIFANDLDDGKRYDVIFVNTVDGSTGTSRGKVSNKRDLADGNLRNQLRARVPDVGMGPCKVTVYDRDRGKVVAQYNEDKLIVAGEPVQLGDVADTVERENYRAAVDRSGTLYIPLDVANVTNATRFTGGAMGLPLGFQATDVAIYNDQGFLMQLLDPTIPGLFDIFASQGDESTVLSYWRHEFRTYKQQHRDVDAFATTDDPDWHDDGSRHVDHDHLVLAVRGKLPDGSRPSPGATAPFQLLIVQSPEER